MNKLFKKVFMNEYVKGILRKIFDKRVYKTYFGSFTFLREGGFEFLNLYNVEEIERLRNLDLDGKIVYDFGAYVGLMSIMFSKCVKDGMVFSFEPNPKTYQKLQNNLRINKIKNVKAFNLGVGNKTEIKKMFLRMFESRAKDTILNCENKKSLNVKVVNISEFVKENNLPLPDFIKIDVEGFGYEALLGLEELIKECKPQLYFELHTRKIPGLIQKLLDLEYDIRFLETMKKINSKEEVISGKRIICQ